MTGRGSIAGSDVTHRFSLRCDVSDGRQSLRVRWGENQFRLDELVAALCEDNPALDPQSSRATFDTYIGSGAGRLNGQQGAWADWILTDGGSGGENDFARFEIYDPAGNLALSAAGFLQRGNHRAFADRPSANSAGLRALEALRNVIARSLW